MYPSTHLTAPQLANLHDRARSQALEMRRAAIAHFWQGARRFATEALRALRGANTAATRNTITTISRNLTGV